MENSKIQRKKAAKRRRLAFAAALIVVCMAVSSVSGAVSSYMVYNMLLPSTETTSAAEESTTGLYIEESTTQISVIFPEETTVLEITTEEHTFAPETVTETTTNANIPADVPIAEKTTAAPSTTAPSTTVPSTTVPSTTVPSTSAPENTTQAKPSGSGSEKSKGEIYSQAVDSIVCITITGYTTYSSIFGQSYKQKFTSSGSGFIISKDGYIVTNHHVIEDAEEITVSTYDGSKYSAKLIGSEAANDVAVIKIDGSFTPVKLGKSSSLQVGDEIMVIGNALGELAYTFTDGIVSYLSRSVTTDAGTTINMFQTNAAINEGNSGGPVYNMKGEVVGIASAKYASSSIEGLGFCIPIDDVKAIINDLKTLGYVSGKPLLGISVQTINSSMSLKYGYPTGCYIVALDEDSCAAKAGLKETDVITHIDGSRVSGADALSSVLSKKKAGDSIEITYTRGSSSYTLTLVLDEYKPAQPRTSYSNVYDF